jgi:hypothetical protein
VRFDVQRPVVAVSFLIYLEPWLGVERFCLNGINSLYLKPRETPTFLMYPKNSSPDQPGRLHDDQYNVEDIYAHERLLPVIVVLLRSSDAQGAICRTSATTRRPDTCRLTDATGTTKELATAQLDLPTVDTLHRWSDQIPIQFGVEILGPASSHVYVFEIFVMWSSFDD